MDTTQPHSHGHSAQQKYVAPDFKRRQLIFDSFFKLKRSALQGKGIQASSSSKNTGTALYTWGAGYHGQLGIDSQRKKSKLVPARIDEVHIKEPVLQIACGGFHTAVLCDTGRVYTWGDGKYGQLGFLARKHNMYPVPRVVDVCIPYGAEKPIPWDAHCVHISCGQYHTAAVTERGEIYTWGSGKFGQLGHGGRLDSRYPKRVEFDNNSLRFLQVSCGDRHTTALSRDGKVVTFGSGERGQLGHGNERDSLKPKVVEALADVTITDIQCGSTMTCGLTESGKLYLWGFGESIHPRTMTNIVDTPRLVKMKAKIKQVACGQSHIMILTDGGNVYVFGNGHMGQLGHGSTSNVRQPRLVLKGKQIQEIAAGRYHSVAVSAFGVLYTWGCGESGQLGHNSLDSEMFPRIVDAILPNVIGQIACGEHHTFCLSSMPHQSVNQDVANWKQVEDEELALKKNMIKDLQSGLTSKEILKVERERERIIKEISNKAMAVKAQEQRELELQLSEIKGPQEVLEERKEELKQHTDEDEALLQAQLSVAKHEQKLSSAPAQKGPSPSGKGKEKTMAPSKSQPTLKPVLGKDSADDVLDMDELGGLTMGVSKKGMNRGKQARSVAVLRTVGKKPAGVGVAPLLTSTGALVIGSKTVSRPTSAQLRDIQTGLTSFHPAQPRMMFMEKTTLTLKKIKSTIAKRRSIQQKIDTMAIYELHKQYNDLRSAAKAKLEYFDQLKNAYNFMQPTEEDQQRFSQNEMRLKDLNMKLVTLQTRLMEADENKRNYELYIIRMKEEDVQLSKKIHHHRRLVTEYDRLLTKMDKMNSRVSEQRKEIMTEIDKFQRDIDSFSRFAADQLQRYRNVIDQQVIDQRANERKTLLRNTQLGQRRRARLQKLKVEASSAEEEASEVKKQLEMWTERVGAMEKKYHQITAATGLSKPEDIINKFYFNSEIKNDLSSEVESRKRLITEKQAILDELKAQLEDMQSSHVQSKWRDVDHLQDHLFQVELGATRLRGDTDRLVQKLAAVQEGAMALLNQVEEVVGPDRRQRKREDFQSTQEACQWWIGFLERRVTQLAVAMNRKKATKRRPRGRKSK